MINFFRILAYIYLVAFLIMVASGAFGVLLFKVPVYVSVAMIFGLPVSMTYLLWARGK